MTWSLHPAQRLLAEYREPWQTLNARCYAAHPLLDTKFVVPLYECFGSDNTLLLVREEARQIVGLALVERAGIGTWRLFMPSQANIGPLLLDDRVSATRACQCLNELMQLLPGVSLQMGLQKQDPRYSRLAEIEHDPRLERISDWNTTHIDTRGGFEHFWQTRSKKVRQDVRRMQRRLETEGVSCRIEELSDETLMKFGVRDHGEMESAGWKGREGTAIRHDNIQGEFYTRVLQEFARTGGATIYQLYFNNRLAASLLTISQNHMLVVLKTTYDESMANLSPGRLIDYFMFERVFAESSIGRIENYTNASAADARWCSGSRVLYHVNYYRSPTVRRMAEIKRRVTTLLSRCVGTNARSEDRLQRNSM